MATLFGVNATKRDVNVPSVKIDSCDQHSRVRHAYDEYVVGAAETLTSGDVIKFMKIPAGCRVLEACMFWDDMDGSTGAAGSLGYADNGIDGASANGLVLANGFDNAGVATSGSATVGLMKKFSAETQVQVALTGTTGTPVAAGKKIRATVLYALD